MLTGPKASTFVYEFFIDEDFVIPQIMTLPGFYIESDINEFRLFRPKITNGEILMNTNKCDFCNQLNQNAPFGTLTKGEWIKVEQRVRLNDPNESNGEYIMFWNGVEVLRRDDLSEMLPSEGGFRIAAARMWTMVNKPAAESTSSIYYRQVAVKKFVSSDPPHTTTVPAITTYPVTTTPTTTPGKTQ